MTEQPLVPQADILANHALPPEASMLGGSAITGQVSAEAGPPQTEFTRLVDGFSALVLEMEQDQTLAPGQKLERIKKHIADFDIEKAVEKGEYSAAELGYLAEVLISASSQGGLQLTSMLAKAKRPALDELYRNGNQHLHTAIAWSIVGLETAIARGASDDIPAKLVTAARFVESMVEGVEGRMTSWMQNGEIRKDLPEPLAVLARNEHFGLACARSEYSRIARESTGNITENRSKLHDAELKILEMLDITPEMADDFRLSLRHRTPPKRRDADEENFDDSMGINKARWVNGLGYYHRNISALGGQRTRTLRDICGIVNFDRYDPEQLKQQAELLKRLADKNLAAQELDEDFTMVLADALGDRNGAFSEGLRYFSKNTIVFEIKHPNDILRAFGLLKAMNIKPSNLVMSTHGAEGRMKYNQKANSFVLSTNKRDKKALHIKHFDFGYLFRNYMKPGKKTGERVVILYACKAAKIGPGGPSMAEGIVLQTKRQDRVVVKAAVEKINLSREKESPEVGPVFYNPKALRKPRFMRRAVLFMSRRPAGRTDGQTAPKGRVAQTWEFRRGRTPLTPVKITKPKKGTPLI